MKLLEFRLHLYHILIGLAQMAYTQFQVNPGSKKMHAQFKKERNGVLREERGERERERKREREREREGEEREREKFS